MSVSSTSSLPTLSIVCFTLHTGEVIVCENTVSPGKNSLVSEITKKIAKEYYCALGCKLDKKFTGTFTFSCEKGVQITNCSDLRMIDICRKRIGGPVAVPARVLDVFDQIKEVEVEQNVRDEASQEMNEPSAFIDLVGCLLGVRNIKNPIALNVEITARECHNTGMLTTCAFRFPHLLFDAFKKYEKIRDSDDARICIVGPGLQEGRSPELAEFFGIFPKASYLVVDNNEGVNAALKGQIERGVLFYDLATLRFRVDSFTNSKTIMLTPKHFEEMFLRIKQVFKDNVKVPETRKFIDGRGEFRTPLLLKATTQKIEVRNFEIITSQFKDEEKGKFDIVVATLSIMVAYAYHKAYVDSNIDPYELLRKFLELLKPGGSFYIDVSLFTYLFQRDFENRWKLLQDQLDSTLELRKIPLTEFLPDVKDDKGDISSLTYKEIRDSLTKKTPPSSYTSQSIHVVTRLPRN